MLNSIENDHWDDVIELHQRQGEPRPFHFLFEDVLYCGIFGTNVHGERNKLIDYKKSDDHKITLKDIELSDRELIALKWLGKPGSYLSNGFRQMGPEMEPSTESVKKFRLYDLIDEQWTWASGSRPCVSITQKGYDLIND